MKRLKHTIFTHPIEKIRTGWLSAVYFNRTKQIAQKVDKNKKVTMQVFTRNESSVCGIDEALAILRNCTGYYKNYKLAKQIFEDIRKITANVKKGDIKSPLVADYLEKTMELEELWVDRHEELEIETVKDGTDLKKVDGIYPAMLITGPYAAFAHLESVLLGILARSTKICTNTKKVVKAANGKPILFFADRFDRYDNQPADGYAAHIAGAKIVASDAMGSWWGENGLGTNPHALIAFFDGDTTQATLAHSEMFPEHKTVALIDFNNNCAETALEVATEFKKKGKELWGVRLDTSGSLIDEGLHETIANVLLLEAEKINRGEDGKLFIETNLHDYLGVCEPLVRQVREKLDQADFKKVKIIVSGGFSENKISNFSHRDLGKIIDGFGVGSSLLKGHFDFTADIVKPVAKTGRSLVDKKSLSYILKKFNWSEIE